MCLNGHPWPGRTALVARDPVLRHLTLHSFAEVIILQRTSARGGEAHHILTPDNIAIVLMARSSWGTESSFRGRQ